MIKHKLIKRKEKMDKRTKFQLTMLGLIFLAMILTTLLPNVKEYNQASLNLIGGM